MNQTQESYFNLLNRIYNSTNIIYPRGLQIKEIEDVTYEIDPIHPFVTFKARKYDLNYFKSEMKWKLGANKYDTSIQDKAVLWKEIINPDGTYNSNYGQFWFGEQMGIWHVVNELMRDPDSRRAVIPMIRPEHLAPHVKDTVCTNCIGFRIRQSHLNMSVHMRSSDIIYGLGTDIPTFSFLYRLVLGLLGDIAVGKITISTMSSHLYVKHYQMAEDVIIQGIDQYEDNLMPFCYREDAMKIIASRGDESILNQSGELGGWLCQP
jgi:thymidylate synthase